MLRKYMFLDLQNLSILHTSSIYNSTRERERDGSQVGSRLINGAEAYFLGEFRILVMVYYSKDKSTFLSI